MKPLKSPQTQNRSLQDSTTKTTKPEKNIKVSDVESEAVAFILQQPKTEPRYLGGQKTQTKKLSKFAKQIIRDCAKDKQFKNVVQVWSVVDTFCKEKFYTPEQVGKFLRYYKQKRIHEELKEKLDSAHVNEHSLNVPDVPNYLTTQTNTLKKSAKKTRNGQELVSGGFF